MPLYEYECPVCGRRLEHLVPYTTTPPPECTHAATPHAQDAPTTMDRLVSQSTHWKMARGRLRG